MTLGESKKNAIKSVITITLRKKLHDYRPESNNMPFHYRLLGKDRMALFSFIHSLNTTFGTSIFEPIAVELAKDRFSQVESQKKASTIISSEAHRVIQKIIDGLISSEREPDKTKEIYEIRQVCTHGGDDRVKLTRIDLFLQAYDNQLYLFDLKTVKPNIGDFQKYKQTLLEWVAAELFKDSTLTINTLLAIPYNPNEPKPYKRWTLRGMIDLNRELMVGKEFWDFLGGSGAYEDLLDCFESVGIEMRPEIDQCFSKYK